MAAKKKLTRNWRESMKSIWISFLYHIVWESRTSGFGLQMNLYQIVRTAFDFVFRQWNVNHDHFVNTITCYVHRIIRLLAVASTIITEINPVSAASDDSYLNFIITNTFSISKEFSRFSLAYNFLIFCNHVDSKQTIKKDFFMFSFVAFSLFHCSFPSLFDKYPTAYWQYNDSAYEEPERYSRIFISLFIKIETDFGWSVDMEETKSTTTWSTIERRKRKTKPATISSI